MTDDEIRLKILEIITILKEIIDAEKEKGAIQPEYEQLLHWNVTDFNYDDNGTHFGQEGEYVTKPIWINALSKILNLLEKNEKYQNFFTFLKGQHEIKEHSPSLRVFIQRIITMYLTKGDLTESEINNYIDVFVVELKNKPIKSGATVHLEGIILHPDKIEICPGITLRKPKKEDFEIDIPTYGYDIHSHFFPPTAFLEISITTNSSRVIQEEVKKAITILRLFKTGSVKYQTYRMYSDSISNFIGGRIGSGDTFPALEKYIIHDEDVENLKKFWNGMSSILPPTLYNFDTSQADHISIAYNSYSDSLLQPGISERRIANAIMGLEALYFKSEERSELNQRLSLRTAKLLSLFSSDPITIRRVVKGAYEVRSTYLHGSRLTEEEKERLLKHYDGNLNNLLKIVLEYLRKSLIIFMKTGMSKESIISLLEDSLISKESDDKLKQKLESISIKIN